jgi:Fe-Mn family superoxide dismutase
MKYELPKLPYSYDALEPYIDAKTMEIHHTKHHQGYVDKLNAVLEKYPDLAARPLEDLLKNLGSLNVDEKDRTAIRNHGGGHINHSLFWQIMGPKSNGEPTGTLAEAINNTFGSFEKFKEEFTNAGLNRFGSGWAWLVLNNGNLEVYSTPNQDSPLMENKIPILGIDVWEHSYYILYNWRRADYIAAWWNIVNWQKAEENYKKPFAL